MSEVFDHVSKEFKVVRSFNKYEEDHHSSDGYFDARLYVSVNGTVAELQIHTRAMQAAKKRVHDLYEERQTILRSNQIVTKDQRKRIAEINKQMRDIFREANNEQL